MVIPWEVIRRDKMKFYYYKISNIKNGSFYIGITTDYLKRKKQHFSNLECKIHPNYKMQKDYDIYGREAFIFEIIDEYAFGANGNLKTVEMGENPSLKTYREGVFLRSPVEDIIIPKNYIYVNYFYSDSIISKRSSSSIL